MKRTMLQIAIDPDVLFDLKTYANDNKLKYSDIVRQLIHDEIYKSYRLAKKSHDKKN